MDSLHVAILKKYLHGLYLLSVNLIYYSVKNLA